MIRKGNGSAVTDMSFKTISSDALVYQNEKASVPEPGTISVVLKPGHDVNLKSMYISDEAHDSITRDQRLQPSSDRAEYGYCPEKNTFGLNWTRPVSFSLLA